MKWYELYPQLLKQWSPKNERLPESYLVADKVWWICDAGHEWQAKIRSRVNNAKKHPEYIGCRSCTGRKIEPKDSLVGRESPLLREWDYEKNKIDPVTVASNAHLKVWWKCSKGHSYESDVAHRTSHDRSCPYCSKQKLLVEDSLAYKYPHLVKEWDYTKNKETPEDIWPNSNRKYWWLCPWGHSYQMHPTKRTIFNCGCNVCNSTRGSDIELMLFSELSALFEEVIFRHRIEGVECDLYLVKENIAIEFDGPWHKIKGNKVRDLRKNEHFNRLNIRLVRIRTEYLDRLNSDDICLTLGCTRINVVLALLKKLKEIGVVFDYNYLNNKQLVNLDFYNNIRANSKFHTISGSRSLLTLRPDIANNWHLTKNGIHTPMDVTVYSNRKFWWKCSICGYEYETTVLSQSIAKIPCKECRSKK